MAAQSILADLEARGVKLVVRGTELHVWPRNQLTGAYRQAIPQNKAALLDLLRQRAEEETFILGGIEADLGLPPGSLFLWTVRG
jgi:hypothetical protein